MTSDRGSKQTRDRKPRAQQAAKRVVAEAATSQPQEIKAVCTHPEWKAHLDCYPEKRALTFASDQVFDAAIDLLWTDELRTLPHDLAGRKTIIVPAEAVAYFARAGLQFTDTTVRSVSDLNPEEIRKLRR